MRAVLIVLALLSVLAGCTDVHSRPSGGTPISGSVVMGAPVADATVTLYSVNPVTRKLTAVASARSGVAGVYTLIAVLSETPYLLIATGGSYKDDATGEMRSLAKADPTSLEEPRPGVLETLVGSGEDSPPSHHLTPFTTIAVRRVAILAQTEGSLTLHELKVAEVNKAVATGLNVGSEAVPVDPRTLLPLDYTNPADAEAIKKKPLAPASLYGAALSGLSKLASTLALADTTVLVFALAEDFSDGKFDGVQTAPNGNPAPTPLGSGTLSPTATTNDLEQATASFLGDATKNLSGAPAAALGPQ